MLEALISGGASILGGLYSNYANRKAAQREVKHQREFAQHGVRWRVEDAKAAGLHPLYALGAQLPSYSPVSVQDSLGPALAQAGQQVGGGMRTAQEKALASLALQQAQKNLEESDARILALKSEAARNAQSQEMSFPSVGVDMATASREARERFGTSSPIGRAMPQRDQMQMATQFKPEFGDPGLAKGGTPLWRKFTVGVEGGRSMPIVLPGGMAGDAAEVMESVGESIPLMIAVYKENVARYGEAWGDWFIERYMPFGDVANFIRRTHRSNYARNKRAMESAGRALGRANEWFWKKKPRFGGHGKGYSPNVER